MNAIDQASAAQIEAATPTASTWVSANAGSGKTRVLTNRVARLLLSGCEPQKILCLTYTKAAAAEMQNRLFDSLGEWAMKPDAELRDELATLGETALDADRLKLARTLFARALETPGGLKIQTIHSFCGAILRRFPLEAGVSPQFQEMEDRQAKLMRADIIEEIAETSAYIFDQMARYLTGDDVEALLGDILRFQADFVADFDADATAQVLGTQVGLTDERILAGVMGGVSDADIAQLAEAMATGSASNIAFSQKLPLAQNMSATAALVLYEDLYLTQKGTARKQGFPIVAVKKAFPDVANMLDEIKERMVVARDQRLARLALARAETLHNFAAEFLGRYRKRKAALGRLDFEDLIQKTRTLLSQSNMAAWVLYRLDGGIDHILVDEAQDTSPAQWDIVQILAEEFHVGGEERETPRTIFVVGDEKQSIYSFQGADPSAFGAMRTYFLDRLAGVAQALQQTELLYSFRSAAPVLALVDKVFTGDAREGLHGEIQHRAVKDLPGRVELWPFVEKPASEDPKEWWLPVDSAVPNAPHVTLANALAGRVADLIATKHVLPGTDRAVSAGDFLILVQTRGKIFHAIIKALKERGVDVAGADRLKIGEELAVKDLLALMQFLATPEDDLSLAATLRSPLFGLSEKDLFKVAHDRKGTLWQSLRHGWPEAVAMLDDLLRQADFVRPYDLLERVLIRHDGRRKLVARLGVEAEDGIDELLTQALRYESVEAPLLTGFLGWISSDDVEVKRQMDAAGDRVRVMTVHGAKGLEAPIVILPDTTKRAEGRHAPQVARKDGLPLWKATADGSPQAMLALEDARKQLVREESRRLLYVALTRAENWLIVCGAGELDKGGDSWFQRVEAAMGEDAVSEPAPDGLSGMAKTVSYNWDDRAAERAVIIDARVDLPDYLREAVPAPERAARVLSPSDLGGAHVVSGSDGDASALERGNLIHLLLEVLPTVPKADRAEVAQELVEDWESLLPEVEAALKSPELQGFFSDDALAEVPITAALGAQRMLGRIDRLLITDTDVLALDFKSNREVPAKAEDTPEAILRQMGAYSQALEQIYPNHKIRTIIFWTASATLMELPENVTATALNLDALGGAT